MTGLDLFAVQQDIKQYFIDNLPVPVSSGAIPTSESLPFVNGILEPFIVLRFSDSMPSSGDASFGGPVHDGYYSYVDALCLGQTDDDARELASLVGRTMISKRFPNTGSLRKIYGGGQFAIASEANRQPVAFVAVSSFQYLFNVDDVGANSLVFP